LIVTDSTASIPKELRSTPHLEIVNLHVIHGGESFEENAELLPEHCAELVERHVELSTSQPPRSAFEEVFSRAFAEGYAHVVGMFIPQVLSGTEDTARAVATQWPGKVHIVSSRTTGMALGLTVIQGARAAREGMLAREIVSLLKDATQGSGAYFMVDSLDHLRRGGRLGATAAAVGTVLGLKPVLAMSDDGHIEVVSKERSRSHAIRFLHARAIEAADSGAIELGVHYFGDPNRAHKLAEKLRQETSARIYVSPASAVLGVHVGPGMLAVTYA
jgi:DegV family protein with EDD domain